MFFLLPHEIQERILLFTNAETCLNLENPRIASKFETPFEACKNDHIKLIKYYHETGYIFTPAYVQLAIYYNKFDILIYLNETIKIKKDKNVTYICFCDTTQEIVEYTENIPCNNHYYWNVPEGFSEMIEWNGRYKTLKDMMAGGF